MSYEAQRDDSAAARSAHAWSNSLGRGIRIGRYVVLDQVGSGGMGVVYSAFDPQLNRRVAIKIFSTLPAVHQSIDPRRKGEAQASSTSLSVEEAQAMLLAEARASAKVSSPNVVPIYDAAVHEGQLYLAMEYVHGQTLRALLRARTTKRKHAVQWLQECAQGLADIHRAGLIHGDFKPENVMVDDSGVAKILDLGLARPPQDIEKRDLHPSSTSVQAKRSLPIQGTLNYLAPEMLAGEPPSVASDIFAFGISAYEILCGQRPFVAHDLDGARKAQSDRKWLEAPHFRNLPRPLRHIVAQALCEQPQHRHASAESIAVALKQFASAPKLRAANFTSALSVMGLILGIALPIAAANEHDGGEEHCAIPARFFERPWNDQRRDLTQQSFAASGSSIAQDIFSRLDDAITTWHFDWRATYEDLCAIERQRMALAGSQSSAKARRYRQQVACLDRTLRAAQALLTNFENADKKTVERALTAFYRLEDAKTCRQANEVSQEDKVPEDVVQRQHIEYALERLGRAEVALHLGNFDLARSELALAETQENATPWPPLRTRIQLAQLLLAQSTWQQALTYRLGMQAFFTFTARGQVARAAAGLRSAVIAGSYVDPSPEQQEELTRSLHALAARQPDDDNLMFDALSSAGASRLNFEDGVNASTWYTRAYAHLEKMGETRSRRAAITLSNRGYARAITGNPIGGELDHRAALRILESLFGRHHPELSVPLYNLAFSLIEQDRPQESLEFSARGIEIITAADGELSPRLIPLLDYRALALARMMRWRDAQEYYPALTRAMAASIGPSVERTLAMNLRAAEIDLMLGELEACRQKLTSVKGHLEPRARSEVHDQWLALSLACAKTRGEKVNVRADIAKVLATHGSPADRPSLVLAALDFDREVGTAPALAKSIARAAALPKSVLDRNLLYGRFVLVEALVQIGEDQKATQHLAKVLELSVQRTGLRFASPRIAATAIELAARTQGTPTAATLANDSVRDLSTMEAQCGRDEWQQWRKQVERAQRLALRSNG